MATQSRYQEAIKALASAGSQRKAAALLGIGRTTLAKLLQQGPAKVTALSAQAPGVPAGDLLAVFEAVKSGSIGVTAAARSVPMNQSTFSRKYAKWSGVSTSQPQATAVPRRTAERVPAAGLAGFKALFSPAQRGHDALTRLIAGELKTRGWIYDSEMRGLAGVDSVAWTNLRRDYEALLVEVRDPESHTKKTVWCHPDIVEEARQVAKERAR